MTAVLLIDEDCGICVAAGAWVARRSPIVVLGNRSTQAGVHLRDLAPAARTGAVHHVDACGRRTSGGAALAAVLREIPGWAWLGGLLRRVPGITESGYRLVSRHRGRLSRWAGLRACGVAREAGAASSGRGEPPPSPPPRPSGR